MSAALALDGFALLDGGPTLTLRLEPRQAMFVYGRAASGKTSFLKCLAGISRPLRGSASLPTNVALASVDGAGRRATPEAIAKRAAGHGGASRVAEALTALNLWERRTATVSELTPGQIAALELVPVLSSSAQLLLIDGQLDALDPWTLHATLELIGKRLARGASLCAASSRPEFIRWADLVVVWKDQSPIFAGTPADLARTGKPDRVEVRTLNRAGAKGIAEPFAVRMESTPSGLIVHAESGQALAARLLLEGYGDVEAVTIAEQTLDELLRALG